MQKRFIIKNIPAGTNLGNVVITEMLKLYESSPSIIEQDSVEFGVVLGVVMQKLIKQYGTVEEV